MLSMTMPETAMALREFEGYLTDYLDGFLPAALFHRWERHAALCNTCRTCPEWSFARSPPVIHTRWTSLPFPRDLHERILKSTLGTVAS